VHGGGHDVFRTPLLLYAAHHLLLQCLQHRAAMLQTRPPLARHSEIRVAASSGAGSGESVCLGGMTHVALCLRLAHPRLRIFVCTCTGTDACVQQGVGFVGAGSVGEGGREVGTVEHFTYQSDKPASRGCI
jgi:hypothetical protein